MRQKILGIILWLACVQGAHAADNLFEKNYQPQDKGALASSQANPDTQIYVSSNKEQDNISMLERGYDLMGSSAFEATQTSPDLALQHAKAIKADTVLVYKRPAKKKSALSRLQVIKEAARTTGEVEEKVLQQPDDTVYAYYASYWAKLPMPLLGVHVIKLVAKNEQDDLVPEAGVKVIAVIKDSPAAKAGIQRGDVLLKLNDVVVNQPEALTQLVRNLQGQQVPLEFAREEQVQTVPVQLNKR